MATTYANYENFGTYANEIVNNSTTAYNRVKDAYTAVEGLNNPNGWRGVNYDNLVSSFNSLVDSFNTTFKNIQEDIPASIRNIASLYASFDTSSVSKAADTYDKITELEKSNTTALTFEIENVSSAKDSVNSNLDEAKNNMVNIKNTMKNMNTDWQGDEYEAISGKIFNFVEILESNMNTLKNDFDKYFSETNQEYISTKAKVENQVNIG